MNNLLTEIDRTTNLINIFTDGSYTTKHNSKLGYSFVVEYDENIAHAQHGKMKVGRNKKNLGMLYAETIALCAAVEYVIDKRLTNVIIYSDSKFAVNAIHHPSRDFQNPVLNSFINKMNILLMNAKKANIVLNIRYCRGHANIESNELADSLAKNIRQGKNNIHSIVNRVLSA